MGPSARPEPAAAHESCGAGAIAQDVPPRDRKAITPTNAWTVLGNARATTGCADVTEELGRPKLALRGNYRVFGG